MTVVEVLDDEPTLRYVPRPGLWGAFEPDADKPVAVFGTRRDADDWLLSGAGDAWDDLTIRRVKD